VSEATDDQKFEIKTGERRLTFHSLEELRDWAARDHEFWQEVSDKLKAERPLKTDDFLKPLVSRARQLHHFAVRVLNETNPANKPNQLSGLKETIDVFQKTRGDLTHDTATAKEIANLADSDPLLAWARLLGMCGGRKPDGSVIDPAQIKDWFGILTAFDRLRSDGYDPAKASSALDDTAGQFQNRWDKRLQDHLDSLDSQIDGLRERKRRLSRLALSRARKLRRLYDDHAKRMENIEQAFTTKMELAASEYYWGNKQREHKKRGELADLHYSNMLIVGLLAVAGCWGMAALIAGLPPTNSLSLTHTLFFALPVLLYVWVLRHYAQERKQNLRMADDAEERVAMVKTFLALEVEDKATREERLVILNALFRPYAASGDENVPFVSSEMLKQLSSR